MLTSHTIFKKLCGFLPRIHLRLVDIVYEKDLKEEASLKKKILRKLKQKSNETTGLANLIQQPEKVAAILKLGQKSRQDFFAYLVELATKNENFNYEQILNQQQLQQFQSFRKVSKQNIFGLESRQQSSTYNMNIDEITKNEEEQQDITIKLPSAKTYIAQFLLNNLENLDFSQQKQDEAEQGPEVEAKTANQQSFQRNRNIKSKASSNNIQEDKEEEKIPILPGKQLQTTLIQVGQTNLNNEVQFKRPDSKVSLQSQKQKAAKTKNLKGSFNDEWNLSFQQESLQDIKSKTANQSQMKSGGNENQNLIMKDTYDFLEQAEFLEKREHKK